MQPRFIADGDTISYEVHTCIVFTADGSGPQLKAMVTRSVAMEDNPELGCFDRCVDLATTYGSEVRKTRSNQIAKSFLVFYNLSPKLPVNRTLARLVDFSPNDTPRLFWRGDVVVMKGDLSGDPHVRCLDASTDDISRVQDFFLDEYSFGHLERDLDRNEFTCEQLIASLTATLSQSFIGKFYCKQYCQSWLGYQMGAQQYWGVNFKQHEGGGITSRQRE